MVRSSVLAVTVALLVGFAGPGIAPGGAPADAGPPATATSDDGGDDGPDCKPGTIVDNDDVRIWFHGSKGMLQVWSKEDDSEGNDGKYKYKTLAIRELDQDNETIAWFNYERANPQLGTCEISEDETFVNVTYVSVDTVYAEGEGGDPVGEARVALEYHFNKSSNAAKFDLNIQDWPWQGDGTLAYDFVVTTEGWDIETAENGLGFRGEDDNETKAFIEWAPNATAYYEDGHNETAVVDAETENGTYEGEEAAFVTLEFTQATPGYVELDYDPTVGAGSYIIVAGVLMVTESTLPLPKQIDDIVWAAF